jgi:hypothetical protein
MFRTRTGRGGWFLALTLGFCAATAQAQEYRYRYVSLNEVELPPEILFFNAVAIHDSGQVFGNAYALLDEFSLASHVAVYRDGAVTVLQPGSASVVNASGTVGGSVEIDPENWLTQAALFRGAAVELIPPQPGELMSWVEALNDSGTALVRSYDESFEETLVLYKNGQTTVLDFGPLVSFASFLAMNNQGIISGTTYLPELDAYRGFRHDPRTGETTLLDPLPSEPHSWTLGVNSRGAMLGYSFVFGAIERIGVWDRKGQFHTYFVQGTAEFPTISNRLLFNDENLIVITRTEATDGRRSYLVPEPGVRLDLAGLVEDLPPGEGALWNVRDVNNDGSMIGRGFGGNAFLLERIDAEGP